MTIIQTTVPDRLYQEAKVLIKKGWFKDENDLFLEALRRYLETHEEPLMEQSIREDVEWGLHGKE